MRKKWLATVLSATALATFAAGCGDDDDGPGIDARVIDAAMADTGMMVDAAIDAQMADAAMASHSGTIVVSEVRVLPNAITGANAFDTASTSLTFSDATMASQGGRYDSNPALTSPVGKCVGFAFGAGLAAPPGNGGDAGSITITGHEFSPAGGCTPIAGVAGCAAQTITCTRGASPFFSYTCNGPAGPVVEFLKDDNTGATPSKLTIAAAGGAHFPAFSSMPTYFSDVTFDAATATALTTQKWDGSEGFTATIGTAAGVTAAPGVAILRIEATDGNPALAGTQADCTAADASFPTLGHCNTTKQALITCAAAANRTISVLPAAFMQTFNATGLVGATAGTTTARVVRVTLIGTGGIAPTTPASTNPNKTLVAAGQGQAFIDTTP
ncbi:MAG: hypothetical protein IT370_23920 [Deltaproteobacteria bacterium]|nr:hypothetical protein [Deltaproteobacteria bacterium]